jgi:hypothetical protein
MTQNEQVIEVMKNLGGYATLGQLYNAVDVSEWGTKTPFASIRRIVQINSAFFKIRPGLWALKAYKDIIPPEILPPENAPKAEKDALDHYFYQGLLVQLGNMANYKTYVPAQDKNQPFLDARLGEIAHSTECPKFTYEEVVQRIRSIDVIWFNERRYPHAVYEVEHTTDFQNSLGKFVELQDFYVEFWIVAHKARKNEFQAKINFTQFQPIAARVKFLDYEQVAQWHDKSQELQLVKP